MRGFAIGLWVAAGTSIASADAPSSPEIHRNVGRIALGLGESVIAGRVRGRIHQGSSSVRINERDWIGATYARAGDLDPNFGYTTDLEVFYEVGLHASRSYCQRDEPICVAPGVGLGYQRVQNSEVDELGPPHPPSGPSYHDNNALYGELRVALRVAYEHVWIEGAVGMRIYRPEDPPPVTMTGGNSGFLVGIAIHLLP